MDESQWPRKADVAAELGLSEKGIYRATKRGQLSMKMQARPGYGAECTYDPDSVARYKAALIEAHQAKLATVSPAVGPITEHGPSVKLLGNGNGHHGQEAFLEVLRSILPVERGLFMTYREASKYTKLPRWVLEAKVAAGKIRIEAVSRDGKRVKLRKADLDKL
jgi:excisionase family DNA binding protein